MSISKVGGKMKILYMTMMYPVPGCTQKGVFCHEQVKALIHEGVEVDVIVPLPFYDDEYETDTWIFEGVKIRYIKYFKIPGTIGFQYIGKYLYLALKKAKIDFKKYDILHADAPLPAGDAIRRISKEYHIPYVIHGHGLDVFFSNSYREAKNCKKITEICIKVYEEADAVAGVSQKVLNCIKQRVDISSKGYVIYNGVDTEKLLPIEHENKKLELISIGNLIPLKGHKYTILAIKKLVEAGYDNVHLRIFGRGEQETELVQLVQKIKMENYVQFMGYVQYEQVAKALQMSDIFILPSYYEALGCVYLEAMACGIPVIGCKENGIDEIIKDGEDGYLIQGKSVESIVESIKKMLENRRYKVMGVQARKHVEEKYSWRSSAQSLIKLYRNIIG